MGEGGEGGDVMGIEDETGYLVGFVGDEGLSKKRFQGHIGKGQLRGGALFGGRGGQPCQLVAGARGRSLPEENAQVRELINAAGDGVPESHRCLQETHPVVTCVKRSDASLSSLLYLKFLYIC